MFGTPRSPRTALLLALAAVAICLIPAATILLPRVAAKHLRPHDKPQQYWASEGFPIKYAGPVVEIVPEITIVTPQTMRATQSDTLTISISGVQVGHSSDISPGPGEAVSDQAPTVDNLMANDYTVSVAVGGDIGLGCGNPSKKTFGTYPGNMAPRTWSCVLHPKDAGDYVLLITGLPDKSVAGSSFRVTDAGTGQTLDLSGQSAQGRTIRRDPDGMVTLPIQVLTIEGLTALQYDLLKIAGTLIGVLGTILAYPFLKSLFHVKPPEQPADPASGQRPAMAGGESSRTTERKRTKRIPRGH